MLRSLVKTFNLTPRQTDSLTIGRVMAWHYDVCPGYSDQSAVKYNIDGLPPPLSAILHGFEKRWDFEFFSNNQRIEHPKTRCYSKEEAFVALKEWLRAAVITASV